MSKHPWLRRLAIALALCVVVVVALVAFLLFFQPTLNLSPFKGLLESQLTGLTGVPIALEELHLKPSLEPEVEVRDLRAGELASVQTTQLQIELIPLLKRHISIDSLKLDEVTVQLRPTLDSVRSWIGQEDRPKSPYRVDALENLEFDRVQVNVTDDLGVDHRLVIDELDGGITRESSLMLEARGSFDGTALHFQAEGPTLEELFDPASTLPLTTALEIAGARLSADGALTRQTGQPILTLEFGLEGDDLETTLAAAGVRAPALGSFQFQGILTHSGGPFDLTDLQGRIGEAELSGNLLVSFENERLALEGSLDTGRIDLRPWLDLPPSDNVPATHTPSEQRIFDHPIPVEPISKVLGSMDVDLDVSIEGLDGLPTSVEEIDGHLLLQDGRLTLPYELQLAEAPIRVLTEVAAPGGSLEVALDLSSARFPLDQLSQDLGEGLTSGTVGQLRVLASSSGDTIGDLLNQLVLELESGDTQIRFSSPDKQKKVDLVLTQLDLERSPSLPAQLSLVGDLRGYPYEIELKAQDTKDWRSKDPWPFTLVSEGLGGKTRLDGRLSLEPEDWFLELELEVSGDRIGDLEPWWGLPADADYPYELYGDLILDADRLELNLDELRIGQTAASLSLLAPPVEVEPVRVTVNASVVALDQLLHLIELEEEALAAEPELRIDVPIFPGELKLPDTRIHVELDRVLRDAEALSDLSAISADIEILQSHLEGITFSGRADEASLQGQVSFDWQLEPATMNLELTGESLDLGRLVSLEPITPGLVVRSRHLDLRVTGAERTLRQMFLEGVEISGRAEGVFLSLPSFDAEELFELTLDEARLSSSPERLLVVEATGHLRDWPVDLRLTVDNRVGAGLEDDHLPIDLALETGDVRLQTRGTLTLPATADSLDLEFDLRADRVSSFEPFTGHRVSEVGPVAAAGQLAIRADRFAVRDLLVELGQSDAGGQLTLYREGPRPRLVAELSSQRLHLAELFAHAETPEEDPTAPPAEPPQRADQSSSATEEVSWLERLQSSRLAKVDLDLNLQSEDIYWGGEHGGRGQIRVRSEAGRLVVEPFQLALAEGSVAARAEVLADANRLDVDMELQIYDLEYGPLLRYFNPDAEGSGRVDLETRVAASSSAAGELIKASNGDFRFALFPRNIDTTLINFWGAGLFSSMIRVVDPTDESILNCIMGDFQLTDGLMTAEEFWFDTSRVRARGKGSIDLVAGTIDMKLHPRPKKRTFLTLATPARVRGPLEKPKISLTTGGLVGTAFRLYMWWLTIYAQVLKKPLPKDGSDVCFLPPPPETVDQPQSESITPPNN